MKADAAGRLSRRRAAMCWIPVEEKEAEMSGR